MARTRNVYESDVQPFDEEDDDNNEVEEVEAPTKGKGRRKSEEPDVPVETLIVGIHFEVRAYRFRVIGLTPLFCHEMTTNSKAQLMVGGRKAGGRKQMEAQLKDDPVLAYRESMFIDPNPGADTLICLHPEAFKKALSIATPTVPLAASGRYPAKQVDVDRLVRVTGERVPVWGIPQLHLAVVTNSGPSASKAVRSRAYLPRWCAELELRITGDTVKERALIAALQWSGRVCGVGDFRVGKGLGDYGQFAIVPWDDPQWAEIQRTGGRAAQEIARQKPEYANHETTETMMAYYATAHRKEFKPTNSPLELEPAPPAGVRLFGEEAVQEAAVKKPRGRPRKTPLPEPHTLPKAATTKARATATAATGNGQTANSPPAKVRSFSWRTRGGKK